MLPIVSKVFEKIVYSQLYHYLNDNKLLLSCQSGFHSVHSTLTALLVVTNDRSVDIDNGLSNAVVFIDLPNPGGTPLFGLYGDVSLDGVWFLASLS